MFESVFCLSSPRQQSQNNPAVLWRGPSRPFWQISVLSVRHRSFGVSESSPCQWPGYHQSISIHHSVPMPTIKVRLPHQVLLKLSRVCQVRFASLPRRDGFLNRRNVPEDSGAHAQRQPVILRNGSRSLSLSLPPSLSLARRWCFVGALVL